MKLKQLIIIITVIAGLSSGVYGMRMAPRPVEPVIDQGIEYKAPHEKMGYVQAWKGNTLLWEKQVYIVQYRKELETDVQDVFITNLNITDGILTVSNEKNETFRIDLKSIPEITNHKKDDAAKLIVQGNNAFAFDLYAQLKNTDGNLFFSPYSISTALAMTYAGAKEQTAEQMAKTLRFRHYPNLATEPSTEPQIPFHPAYGRLIDRLNQQGQKGDYQLSIANALWGQQGYPFLDSFINLNEQYYKAGLENVDFTGVIEREQTRQTINSWVEKQTNGKIKNLIPQGVLDAATRLVLTNAIYFKGDWAIQFDPADTKEENFYLSPDTSAMTPLMNLADNFNYAETDRLQILELPYKANELSMLILLPKVSDKGGNLLGANPSSVEVIRGRSRKALMPRVGSLNLPEVEGMLNGENLQNWQKQMKRQNVQVFLPKFRMTSQFSLKEILSNMGMPDAFIPGNADFSGMTGTNDLFISAVLHKAFVEVNEEGTEAAAATGVTMQLTAMPAPPPVFRADHPFVFLIKDNNTQSILFVGRVTDPTKEQ